METFELISNFENYAVSNFGNIKNILTGKILKPGLSGRGYYTVSLTKNKKHHTKNVHRLVAEAFIPNQENKSCVDHIDNNKQNNAFQNLRWATKSENAQNSKLSSSNTSGVKGVLFSKDKKKWEAKINLNGRKVFIGYFNSIEEATLARHNKANNLFGEFTNSIERIVH